MSQHVDLGPGLFVICYVENIFFFSIFLRIHEINM